jgi:hypothetical protein
MENKKTMWNMVVVLYLQNRNKGINDPPVGGELPPFLFYCSQGLTQTRKYLKIKPNLLPLDKT